MSQPPNLSSSSSEDEGELATHVQIPQVSLDELRRQNQQRNLAKTAGTNFQKMTGKKFSGAKSVRFPDSYRPRDTIVSNNSSVNESSDSDIEVVQGSNSELPNFMQGEIPQVNMDDDSDDEFSDQGHVPEFRAIDNMDSASDSDDSAFGEELDKDTPLERKPTRGSKSSGASVQPPKRPSTGSDRRPSLRSSLKSSKRPSVSEDITEQNNDSRGAFKSILRKITLADQAYTEGYGREQPSASDTFLGKVLNFSKDGGMVGGGLAPGATRASNERELDEEEKAGMSQDDHDSIEMKPLSFDQLDPEAHKLITSHITESEAARMAASDLETTPSTETSDGFYAPNPDIFLRREALNELDAADDFLLDDGADDGYVAPPKKVHAGVLSSLLRLYQNPQEGKSSHSLINTTSGGTLMDEDSESDWVRPQESRGMEFDRIKKGIKRAPKGIINAPKATAKGIKSVGSQGFKKASSKIRREQEFEDEDEKEEYDGLPSFHNAKPKQPKKSTHPSKKKAMKFKKNKHADQLRITVHISDILQRQRFIMRMCRALMLFGAPTHRLEEYMVMTSRVLEIDGQFIYFPGCMIVSFGDAATRTSEVHLVRCAQGVNLSKLSDTHRIYKAVIHDLIGVEEAAKQLEELLARKNIYSPWVCVLFYGLGSAMVCPFAFGGHWIDMPISFGIGLCVGYLQFIVSAMSNLYSSVFEVTASIVVAFIARAIGSIKGGTIFCFSGIAQGSLALILPGYIILTGSLELQSRNLVAGSVRMFYAIIYSLFLGFGITLGGALYGWVDHNAVSANNCSKNMDDKWRIFFVPMFAISLGLINQARWQQLPVMTLIASAGYVATYFAGKHFSSVTEFTSCIGAFIVGILGNLYSRIWKGMAVSAMLPAVFVQVPGGLASQSSLVSGIKTADQITHSNSTSSTATSASNSSMSFGVAMVEVSIGISVGLFAAALLVYPFGKKRTGLFAL